MTTGVLARFSFVLPLVVLAVLATTIFAAGIGDRPESRAIGVQVALLGSWALAMPFIGLAAALTAGRLRAAGYGRARVAHRSAIARALPHIAVIAAAGTVGIVGATSVLSAARGAGWWISPPLSAATAVAAIAYAALGFALGLGLRGVFAAPAAFVAPYVLIGFPPAFETPWLRHLTSLNTSCCAVPDDLSTRAWTALMLAMAGLAVGAVSAASVILRQRGALLVLPLAVASLLGAMVVASPLPAGPTQPRAGEPRCTVAAGAAGPRVCLWPEDEAARPQVERFYADAYEVARQHGMGMAQVFTETAPQALRPGDVSIIASPRQGPEQLRLALLPSLFPEPGQGCLAQLEDLEEGDPIGQVWDVSLLGQSWWASRLAISDEEFARASGLPEATLARWRDLPTSTQVDRMQRAQAAFGRCEAPSVQEFVR